jgi:hypothetical protein
MVHFRSRVLGSAAASFLAGGVALLVAAPASAATTIRVRSGCSLTQAVSSLNNLARPSGSTCEVGTGTGDTILLPAGAFDVSARLVLRRTAILKGAGRFATIIRGTSSFTGGDTFLQVEHTGADGTRIDLTVQDLSLEGYDLPEPASGIWVSPRQGDRTVGLYVVRSQISGFQWSGIYAENAQLDVKDSMIAYNSSPSSGGGIFAVGGNFEVQRCAVVNNRAFIGGGMYVATPGNNNVRESTISHNFATEGGGGIASAVEFYLHVINSTVAFNEARIGGGFWAMSQNSFKFIYSIVDENQVHDTNGVLTRNDGFTEQGQNVVVDGSLIGKSAGFTGSYSNSIKDQSAVLDANLVDLGGATHLPVHRLRTGSPAIDFLPFTDSRVDQRGFPVPRQGGGSTTLGWDIGAYEHDPYWQAELLLLGQKSSDTLVKVSTTSGDGTSTSYSNQQGMLFNANAVNDFVTYVVPVPSTRNYTVKVRVRRGSDRGRFQVATSDDQVQWTNVGGPVDSYSSSTNFSEITLNSTSIPLSGPKYFRFMITGKNSSSTGYKLDLDYIRLQ